MTNRIVNTNMLHKSYDKYSLYIRVSGIISQGKTENVNCVGWDWGWISYSVLMWKWNCCNIKKQIYTELL
jgi:hypothetical protein